ncbi:DNA-binding protein [Cryobacterium melibiosiphilum]|uniref:DNA-binding protein n=2 Tax=Cryobacterium melibiosiphilum TaxID=995039 RepID=A0A3A5MKT9_9MICO|nr:DNA-binding protein [Cryobacterium melibiosiphilum]
MPMAGTSDDAAAPPRGEAFAEHVLAIVDSIPPGRVMTYGDIAAVLGSRAARTVGQVLAHSGGTVPWWRVVRHGGHPPPGLDERARAHYETEGTPLLDAPTDAAYRVDYAAARWSPGRP